MRAVIFSFTLMETILNMFCLVYHLRGFMSVSLSNMGVFKEIFHNIYMIVYYAFCVFSLFGAINTCTGQEHSIIWEVVKNSIGAVAFIWISVNAMRDAEKDFYLYLNTSESGEIHPFFEYLRAQSVSAMCCGAIYMLHAVLMFDIYLTSGDEYISDTTYEETSWDNYEYLPIRLYFFSEYIESKFDRYDWFKAYNSGKQFYL